MPELPEVETTLRGITPHLLNQKITAVIVRHPRLRWPIPANLNSQLENQIIRHCRRRGKYLLFEFDHGSLLLHLGMSGRIRILPQTTAPQKHDHVDICLANHQCLRFTDPRRFGAVLWVKGDPEKHPLLAHIGPEPLTRAFSGDYLFEQAKQRKTPVKSFIMDSRIVAGVGNIYATEALFQARVRPQQPAGKVSLSQYQELVTAIKAVLKKSIKKGGTTLKDFLNSDGAPGYFSIELKAYGHAGTPCPRCDTKLKSIRIGQRSTVYCPACQK